MNTAVADDMPAAPAPRRPKREDTWLYLLVVVLVLAAWLLARARLFKSGDDVSYWIAVVGGVMMLVLLLYPARKYLRWTRSLGHLKWWFWMHMVLGIAGPWLILVHSTFHIGSLNAGVALISMLIVVASGIVGRFIYVHIHRGLDGELTTLQDLRLRAGFVESDARSRLAFAPRVEQRLRDFEARELQARPSSLTYLRQVTLLPWRQAWELHRCGVELQAPLQALAERGHWTPEETARRHRQARKLARRYLEAVVRVAQYTAYERVFAMWHIAHLPFVVLLVVSAVVHVVAVHAY